ncbi:MAG: bifunctional serine/threonine-protein kinase/formylglycine-generating enzyme family protein, partial [Bacteroidales bacterium]|nr:bifunctional serine/threonine-protein kinase/formylglycine-generating enzyme family protein [Bacteroidales bacterium]
MTQQEFQARYTYDSATDKLGEGGFGSVFKAYDTHRDRWVALKISKVNPQYEMIRLRREVEMVAKLPSHPNIAYYEECYTFKQMDGEYDFGVLQYYDKGNLGQLLLSNTLTLEQKQSILKQILDGLDFLHQNGIIHRDLKPQNILIVKRGSEYIPKITDFGISKQLDINKSSIFSNSLAGAGTLAYASPEQLRETEIRKNTDLWSFGVIAFQAFTGALPFTTGNHASSSEAGRMELFRQINSGRLPNAIEQIARPWQKVIRCCLVTNPEFRVKNARETCDILNPTNTQTTDEETLFDPPNKEEKAHNILNPKKTQTTDEETIFDTPKPKPKSNHWKTIALGAGLFLIALILVLWPRESRIIEPKEYTPSNIILPNTPSESRIIEPQLVFVQGGTFTMGGTSEQGRDAYSSEKPTHQVALSSYYIGKYPVTQKEWISVMGSNPSHFKGDNLPVESVSWDDVQEFIRKLNAATGKKYRLPTESEWEYAARGGSRSGNYKYSGSNNVNDVAWYGSNSGS